MLLKALVSINILEHSNGHKIKLNNAIKKQFELNSHLTLSEHLMF